MAAMLHGVTHGTSTTAPTPVPSRPAANGMPPTECRRSQE